MSSLWQDLRYGSRILRQAPGFTAIAVATLALAIGGTVAIFAIVNAVLVRGLPFPHPTELVRIYADTPGAHFSDVGLSQPELADLQRRTDIFQSVSAIWAIPAALTGGVAPERIEAQAVSPSYFTLLGAKPELGRTLDPAEDTSAGFATTVVISDALWHRNFGGDRNVLGRVLHLDTDPYTIVGVMPPDFEHPGPTLQGPVDAWVCTGFAADPFPSPPVRAQNFIPGALGRLQPGLTLATAQARIEALAARTRETYPDVYRAGSGWTLRLASAQSGLTASAAIGLRLLLAAVGLVLLIACLNIAGLTLARASARSREMALRSALGAGRARLARQLLCESMLLAAAGGAAALLTLALFRGALLGLVPADLPRLQEVGVHPAVLAFALGLTLVTGVLCGLAPAVQISMVDPGRDLKSGTRAAGGGRLRLRNALVAVEIAVSLVLLAGAGLLLRSFWQVVAAPTGFDPRQVSITQIWIPVPNNPAMNPYSGNPARVVFLTRVLDQVRALPGVEAAAIGAGAILPFVNTPALAPFRFADDPQPAGGGPQAETGTATADYFRALRTPVLEGRVFNDGDRDGHERVAVVNQALVRRYLAGRDPLRSQLLLNGPNRTPVPARIVGVVADMRDDALDRAVQPHIYYSALQSVPYGMTVYVRSSLTPDAVHNSVAAAVHAVDATLPVYGAHSLESLMAASTARRRFLLELMAAFAAMALLLAALGVYGVMAFAVARRTQEIGIRLALGAEPGAIVRLMLRPGLVFSALGLAGGLLAALLLTHAMSSLVYNVAVNDAATYAGASTLLAAAALLACWLPARRATRVDPLIALRTE